MKTAVIQTYPEFLEDELDDFLKKAGRHDIIIKSVTQSTFTDNDCEEKDEKICVVVFYE